MKILHLLDEPWDSGITSYALQIAGLLHKKGETVVVGVRAGKKPETQARELGLTTAVFENGFGLWRILNSQRWDVVNVHTGRAHSWSVLYNFYRRATGRYAPVLFRTRGDARPLGVNPFTRLIYHGTAGVIAASDHVHAQYERELGLSEEQLRTIFPGVETDVPWTPPPANRVGIVGRLDPVKGHAYFLEAAAEILKTRPHVTFLIAGKEAGVTTQLLKNQLQALNINPGQVQFVGFVPSVMEFMRNCTIGVVSSVGSEEISRAGIEWMAAGRPLVGTLVGCLPELIDTGETGALVPPGDFLALAKAIGRLLEQPAEAESMGRKALESARARFSPAVQLEKTFDFYKRALERR